MASVRARDHVRARPIGATADCRDARFPDGFALAGERIDTMHGEPMAGPTCTRLHAIDVFVRPADDAFAPQRE